MKTPKKALLPLDVVFEKRLSSVYRAMKQRFRERRYKSGPRKGQLFRASREIPFTREEFLAWVEHQLGSKEGAVKCAYCAAMLDARNVAFDHMHPIEQGGGIDLTNIVCSCNNCGRLKGPLTFEAFQFLSDMLRDEIGKHLTIMDARDIERRLRGGGGWYKAAKKSKTDVVAALRKSAAEALPF